VTDRHATAPDGARIGFDTAGVGEPLVLLAGQANSRRWWDPVRADFAVSYTTIATDHLGTGTSDSPVMVGPQWRWGHPGPLPVLGDDAMTDRARREHRRASARHDAWEALPGILAPTLVLHGTSDALTPADNGCRLAERISGAQLYLVEGARHAYFLERREQASAAVLRFLAAHPLERS
jgi:pimeloyl-ACP methyl ester carboxylesterase